MCKCDIPSTIRTARKAKGLSVYALAKRSGLSSTHCYAIESGDKSPSLDALAKLLNVLDLDLTVKSSVRSDG